MRLTTRRLATVPALLAAAGLVLAASAVPVLAKEGFLATLDAPIGRDTPGGTTLLVGVTVTFPDGNVTHMVEGSPVYVRLTGPDQTTTWELGKEGPTGGHYTVRIDVPASGVAAVEVGMHGTSDLPFEVVGTALVPGGISARTAQVAPALAPAITPFARASAPAGVPPVVPAVAPAADPGAAPVPVPALVGVGLAAIAIVALVLAAVAIRRARAANAARSSVEGGVAPAHRPNEA